jgi:hypothetical protein
MFVLLKGGIYNVHRWTGLRWHDIRTNFHDDRFSDLINITVITATILEAVLLVLLIEGIYEAVEVTSCGMIYKVSWTLVQAFKHY